MSDLVSATVWTDGDNATIFYDWQRGPQVPPVNWERAGELFVVGDLEGEKPGWHAWARVTDPRFQSILEQATPHFETAVRELILKLNAQGLGLQHLGALIEVGSGTDS